MNIPKLLALLVVSTTACTVSAAPFVAPYQPDDDTVVLYHFNEPGGWVTNTSTSPALGNFVYDSASGLNLQTTDVAAETALSPFYAPSLVGPSGAAMLGTSGSVTDQRLYRQMLDASVFSTDALTVEAWIKPDDAGNIQPYLGLCQVLDGQIGGTINSLFLWSMDGQSDRFRLLYKASDDTVKAVASPVVSFLPDTWYHVAMTVENTGAAADDTQVQFYFTPQTTASSNAVPLGGPIVTADLKPFASNDSGFFEVGGARGSTPFRLGGAMDEFRWSNTVRTRFNMPNPAARVTPYEADADTALLLHLDEPTQSQSVHAGDYFVQDSSGNNLDLRTNYTGTTVPNLALSPFKAVPGPVGLGFSASNSDDPDQQILFRENVDLADFAQDQFTLEMWIRNPDTESAYSAWYQMCDRPRSDTFHSGFFFGLDGDGDQLRFSYMGADSAFRGLVSSETVSFAPDVWYHVAVAFDDQGSAAADDATVTFYCTPETELSGTPIQIGTAVAAYDMMPYEGGSRGFIEVGAARGSSNLCLRGDIDEVRYSNTIRGEFNLMTPSGPVDPPEPIKVYLLAGQSNMQGRGLNAELQAEYLGPVEDCLIYASSQPGLKDLAPGFGAVAGTEFGPELGFGHAIIEGADGEKILLVKHAVSSTDLAVDWDPDRPGSEYATLRSTLAAALASLGSAYDPEIAGFIWMQGESDSWDEAMAAAYGDNMEAFINRVRADLNDEDLPFALGRITDIERWVYRDDVRDGQAYVAETMENVFMIDTDDLTFAVDGYHYGTEGSLELGRRFAQVMLGDEPIPGDLDGDGFVGSGDLDIVRANWGESVDPGCLLCGDPSGDGTVGSADLDIVRANWGQTATATVPEPAFWTLLALGMAFVTARRP